VVEEARAAQRASEAVLTFNSLDLVLVFYGLICVAGVLLALVGFWLAVKK